MTPYARNGVVYLCFANITINYLHDSHKFPCNHTSKNLSKDLRNYSVTADYAKHSWSCFKFYPVSHNLVSVLTYTNNKGKFCIFAMNARLVLLSTETRDILEVSFSGYFSSGSLSSSFKASCED